MNYENYFDEVKEEEINNQLYTMVGEFSQNDYCLISAKNKSNSSAMVGSGGGLGIYMRKPTMWCMFRADRYTLELIEKEKKYTFSYFPKSMKDEVFFMASASGRDSHKMEETNLTPISTPSDGITFVQSEFVIECDLVTLTTVQPEDLCSEEAQAFVEKEYQDSAHYRKIAFGEIKHIWRKKESLA